MKNRSIIIGILANVFLLTGANMVHAYEVGEVHHGGAIYGQAIFSGTPPTPLRFTVDKNPEICGQERSLLKVETHNGLLAGAVVVLEGVKKGKPFPTQAFPGNLPGEGEFRYQGGRSLGLQVKAKGCNFGPFTGVIAADEAVQFENQDSIKHTLHTFVALDSKGTILRTVHNQDIHPEVSIHRTFDSGKLRGSHLVRVTCNRHDFMQNWLYVVDHPYFAISDKEGRFTIDRIPPGTYDLLAWHPILGEQRQEVRVTEEGELKPEFLFAME
jgi:plastocyanin